MVTQINLKVTCIGEVLSSAGYLQTGWEWNLKENKKTNIDWAAKSNELLVVREKNMYLGIRSLHRVATCFCFAFNSS